MEPSEIQSTSRLPKPLDEGTSPELNEKEKGIDSSDAEFPSVEVEQLPLISSDDEKMSNSEPSKDYKPPHFYDRIDSQSIMTPLEEEHYYRTAIYHPDFFSSPRKRKFSENEKKLSGNDEEKYAENDGKSSDNDEILSEKDERYAENEEKSSDYSEKNFSENDEERYAENDGKSSENERYSGHVDKCNCSSAEERKHHSSKSSTVPVISETNDKVIINFKAVTKKSIIRILDNEAKISCEVNYSQTRNYEMSDNGKWVHERKFTKTCKDIIITPKVPKTETSKKRSEDVGFCYPNGSNDSDSDKENKFDAGSSAGNVLGKNEDVKLDNNFMNKCIPSLSDNDGETSECSMDVVSYSGQCPSPSTKRAIEMIIDEKRKKIRLNKEDSVDEEMKNSSEEEKRNC